jgi:hypothetical protein
MKKEEFSKLFREMYEINPKQWDSVLTAAGKTVFSKKEYHPSNANTIGNKAYKKLLGIDYNKFKKDGNKQSSTWNKPQSVRLNGETLQKFRDKYDNISNPVVSNVDSSAVAKFRIDDLGNGNKDVTIQYTDSPKEYLYPDVPANVADGMFSAPSKGSYAYRVISNYSDYSNPRVQEKIRSGE